MTAAPNPERWLDAVELAQLLGVHVDWVRRRVSERSIPFHRVGRCTRFTPADIRAIERAAAVAPTPAPRLRSVR